MSFVLNTNAAPSIVRTQSSQVQHSGLIKILCLTCGLLGNVVAIPALPQVYYPQNELPVAQMLPPVLLLPTLTIQTEKREEFVHVRNNVQVFQSKTSLVTETAQGVVDFQQATQTAETHFS